MEPRLCYTADFGEGVLATTTFDFLRYFKTKDERDWYSVKWSKHPSQEIMGRYFQWVETVNSDIAKKINGKLRYYALLGPELWEQWTHYPDGRIEKREV